MGESKDASASSTLHQTCRRCPAGTFSTRTGLRSDRECTETPPGHYSGRGASTPSECARGHAAVGGMPICTRCEGGTVPDEHSAQCTLCGLHSFAVAGSGDCTACQPGEFTDDKGAPSSDYCRLCAPGSVRNSDNTECAACPRSTFALSGDVTCTGCPVNQFTHFVGATSEDYCTICSAGSVRNYNDTACIACPANTFASENATACTACELGKSTSKNTVGAHDISICVAPSEDYGVSIHVVVAAVLVALVFACCTIGAIKKTSAAKVKAAKIQTDAAQFKASGALYENTKLKKSLAEAQLIVSITLFGRSCLISSPITYM